MTLGLQSQRASEVEESKSYPGTTKSVPPRLSVLHVCCSFLWHEFHLQLSTVLALDQSCWHYTLDFHQTHTNEIKLPTTSLNGTLPVVCCNTSKHLLALPRKDTFFGRTNKDENPYDRGWQCDTAWQLYHNMRTSNWKKRWKIRMIWSKERFPVLSDVLPRKTNLRLP